jgi:hypothetical protein
MVLGWKTTEVKNLPDHTSVRGHTVSVAQTVDVDCGHLAEEVFLRFLHWKSIPSPLSVFFGSKSAWPTLKG